MAVGKGPGVTAQSSSVFDDGCGAFDTLCGLGGRYGINVRYMYRKCGHEWEMAHHADQQDTVTRTFIRFQIFADAVPEWIKILSEARHRFDSEKTGRYTSVLLIDENELEWVEPLLTLNGYKEVDKENVPQIQQPPTSQQIQNQQATMLQHAAALRHQATLTKRMHSAAMPVSPSLAPDLLLPAAPTRQGLFTGLFGSILGGKGKS